MNLELATFDLDGTLIRETVFLAVARGEGLEERFLEWDEAYFRGDLTLEECFHLEFQELVGLPVARCHRHLAEADWVPAIREAVTMLHDANVEVGVLTDQPRFLATYLEPLGFDAFLCSDVEVEEGRVTDRLAARFDKWTTLHEHLEAEGVAPEAVGHVGNGTNDVPVFQRVGRSVAVDPDEAAVAEAADHVLDPFADARDAARALLDEG